MKLDWYNRNRLFDNGIVWVTIGRNGPGLWFSHAFPFVWPLLGDSTVPEWAHRRAYRKRDRKRARA